MIAIIFDGPPGPEAGRFVEVERDGRSIVFGEWEEQADGYWSLNLVEVDRLEKQLAQTIDGTKAMEYLYRSIEENWKEACAALRAQLAEAKDNLEIRDGSISQLRNTTCEDAILIRNIRTQLAEAQKNAELYRKAGQDDLLEVHKLTGLLAEARKRNELWKTRCKEEAERVMGHAKTINNLRKQLDTLQAEADEFSKDEVQSAKAFGELVEENIKLKSGIEQLQTELMGTKNYNYKGEEI